jgi:prophage maintenance system killer protein
MSVSHKNQQTVHIEADKLYADILILKQELINRKEATALFAEEKNADGLHGIVGNVFQSVFGDDAYPSIESKSAHLFYFIVKNHPFTDGNKRS